ncbi:DUF5719 family protein [Arthrobacter russicus]|uniref:Uncharacterized protein n=2 Tax=Arthrobacter russicus TaxID=172040 RepID=A0ABU1JC92_9MICC|nr:hypothetical protein [Arthrobacter russicus]
MMNEPEQSKSGAEVPEGEPGTPATGPEPDAAAAPPPAAAELPAEPGAAAKIAAEQPEATAAAETPVTSAKPAKTAKPAKPKRPAAGKPASSRRAERAAAPRSALRVAAGIASGLGIAVLAAAVVAAGTVFPGQPATARIEPQNAKLPAGQTVANCPGPAQLLQSAAAGTDPQFSPASTSARTQVTGIATGNQQAVLPTSFLAPLSADPGAAPLARISQQPDSVPTPAPGAPPSPGKSGVLAGQAVGGASVLRADPVAGQHTNAAAVQSYSATDGDLRGLAAASCQSPSNDVWLVGASTEVGRTAILTLGNSSATAATVNLDLYGGSGQIQSAGARGILIPPGTERSVVLAGLAPGQKNLAVRARSNGGAISAVIQQSALRGLVPGGVEFLTPVAAPDQAQVITGIQTLDPALAGEISGQSGYSDAQTALQVAVPGASDAIVQVQVFGQGGPASLPNGGVFTAKAGSVTELPLSGLPAGSYTVQISAPSAVTAAVRSVRATKAGDPVDFAMAGASLKISDSQLLVLPAGAASALSFSAPSGKGQLSLTPIGTDGAYQPAKSLDVSGGTTVLIDPQQLAGGPVSGFLVSASGDAVYGAQLLTQPDGVGLSVLSLPRTAPGPQSLKIALGY